MELTERKIAGIFSGIGGIVAIVLGVVYGQPELKTGGMILLSSITAYFVGENNGRKSSRTS